MSFLHYFREIDELRKEKDKGKMKIRNFCFSFSNIFFRFILDCGVSFIFLKNDIIIYL